MSKTETETEPIDWGEIPKSTFERCGDDVVELMKKNKEDPLVKIQSEGLDEIKNKLTHLKFWGIKLLDYSISAWSLRMNGRIAIIVLSPYYLKAKKVIVFTSTKKEVDRLENAFGGPEAYLVTSNLATFTPRHLGWMPLMTTDMPIRDNQDLYIISVGRWGKSTQDHLNTIDRDKFDLIIIDDGVSLKTSQTITKNFYDTSKILKINPH